MRKNGNPQTPPIRILASGIRVQCNQSLCRILRRHTVDCLCIYVVPICLNYSLDERILACVFLALPHSRFDGLACRQRHMDRGCRALAILGILNVLLSPYCHIAHWPRHGVHYVATAFLFVPSLGVGLLAVVAQVAAMFRLSVAFHQVADARPHYAPPMVTVADLPLLLILYLLLRLR